MALDRSDPRAGRPALVVPEAPLPPLPPSVWESREALEAARDQSPGAVVALARRAHGLRQDELGALAGFSQSAISRLESGSNIAYDLRVLRPLQRLLGIPAHLLGLADRTVPIEASEVRRLAPGFAGVPNEGVVGMEMRGLAALTNAADDTATRLMVLRRIFNDAHNRRASGPLMPTVRSMYEFVDRLRRSARGEQRVRLLRVAAVYAEFFGWLHEETADPRGAVQWTARALEQGQAADDRDVVAYSYVRLSQLAEADGDVDRVIGLARAALREQGTSAVVRAIALRHEARGLAVAGDESCMDRLDRALAQLDLAEPREDTDEYWIGYCFTAVHVEMERAASWLELGEPDRAISVYEEVGSRLWPRISLREQGVHLAKLAHAHTRAGNRDEAAVLGYRALDAARTSRSGQVLRELERLGPWAGAADVQDLARRLR